MSRFSTVLVAVFVSLGLMAGSSPAQAQGLALGAEAGATFADFDASEGDADLGSRTGFRVAGVLRYGFGGVWGVQTGVGYAQKGAEDESLPDVTSTIELAYIEIPAFLTLDIPTGPSPLNPRLFAGPQISFESSCEISSEGEGVSATVDCDAEELGAFDTKSADFSLVFGGGLDFGLGGPLALTLDGRYDLGLTDINDIEGAESVEIKNRTFAISGGVLLRLP